MMFLHNLNRIQFIRSVFFSVILGVCDVWCSASFVSFPVCRFVCKYFDRL